VKEFGLPPYLGKRRSNAEKARFSGLLAKKDSEWMKTDRPARKKIRGVTRTFASAKLYENPLGQAIAPGRFL
jgi:hypothetical protein